MLSRIAALARDPLSPVLVLVTHHVEEVPEGFTHAMLMRRGSVLAAGPVQRGLHRAEPVAVLRHPADRANVAPLAGWPGGRTPLLATIGSCSGTRATAEILAILAAAIAAGAINAVVGSGSLITFPTLLAFGFPPVIANVSNNIGLVPGNVSGAFGYREELAGQRGRLIRLGIASCAGALAGAAALLALPPGVFELDRAGADHPGLRPGHAAAPAVGLGRGQRQGARRAWRPGPDRRRLPGRRLRRLLRRGPGRARDRACSASS